MRGWSVVRFAAWAVCLAAAAVAPARADRAVDPEWLPLRPRAEWTYDTHRDQTYDRAKAAIRRTLHKGRTRMVVESAADRVPGGFRVREQTVLQPIEGRGVRESIAGWTLYSFEDALRVHASSEILADQSLGEVVYEPPLRLLATTTVGESWDAGVFRNGAQRAKVRGEVLGIEDLEGTPSFDGCLKVRLAGPISGVVSQTEQQGEIESGEYERLLWFARGVGIVRDVTTLEVEMRMPEERRVRLLEVLSMRLVEHRGAR
ncbi:MAG: hypothetical protein DCC71_12525 [Proteobacteria bacterium]|nr:MAG: hypothetical protein DCC71_12525 [Pseudomonadota bacterium]